MRILMQQAAYFPWVGGAELFAQKVGEHMVRQGHEVDIVTGLWAKPDIETPTWNQKHENINGVGVYRVKTCEIRYIKTLSAIHPTTKKSLELHKNKSYDLIHAHIFPGMVSGASFKKKFPKIPLLTTVQGGDLADYKETTGGFFGVLKPLISHSLKKADLVHGVSLHTARRAIELGAKKTTVIPNGVDTDRFHPSDDKFALRQKYGFGHDEKIIISTSRLTPKNGLHHLIEATAQIKKNIPNIKTLILGGGEQERELKNLIKKLAAEKYVILGGYLQNELLPEYLRLSDVFCRPSLDEGFGISFIEAMASGLPTIGTNVGGIPDIIENESNGFLLEPQNVTLLAERLQTLLDDEKLQIKFRENGLKTIHEKFDWQIVLKQMEELYLSLVS